MSEHTPSSAYPERDRQAGSRIFNLQEVIADIQASAEELTHEGPTQVLIDNPDHVTIVSGYQPGEGEDLHAHPTHNMLLFLVRRSIRPVGCESGRRRRATS